MRAASGIVAAAMCAGLWAAGAWLTSSGGLAAEPRAGALEAEGAGAHRAEAPEVEEAGAHPGAPAAGALTAAEQLLVARQPEFEQGLIQVANGVYAAVGFGVSPSSMIVGADGLIIIDTQVDTAAAKGALAAFRQVSTLPIKAIVFTHGHGDHTGGAEVFAEEDDVQIWARAGFGSEGAWAEAAGLSFQRMRGVRQAGFLLKPEERFHNGIAQAYWPKRGGAAFATAKRPTHLFDTARHRLEIAGARLELVAAPGETADQLYVWHPAQRVLFSGDNFYKSWPNLYAIRGTGYRDVKAWAASIDQMLKERPAHLVGGHTRPISGEATVREVLSNYRDGIRSIFDQTIAGMNQGLTPDQLVEVVKLPSHLAELDYLREYYGNIEWSVRSIFNGYFGWFDGNPSNLFPLSPGEEAARIADLAGGPEALRTAARAALAQEPQWAAQLCDHLLALNPEDADAMRLKAEALDALARTLLTTTGRNYYMTVARQLRQKAAEARLAPE